MSYSPPPTRSKYGDTDFSDDNWSSGSGGTFQTPPLAPMSPGSQVPMQTAGPSIGVGSYGPGSQASGQPGAPLDAEAPKLSLTPEDMLFIRSLQRESLITRVLPLAVMGNASLYLYNRSKELPNKWGRYAMITGAAYLVGKLSYRGTVRQRLTETPLNTPFIQTMRKSFGVTNSMMAMGGEFNTAAETSYNITGQAYPQWTESSSTSNSTSFQGDGGYATRSTSGFAQDMTSSYQPFDSANQDSSKTGTSYEELRAKNRGLIR